MENPIPSYDGANLVNLAAELEIRLTGRSPIRGLRPELAELIPHTRNYLLRRLRRENRTLREETEILAKAAAWFAEKSSDRPRGGVWVRESQPGLPFRAAHVQPPGCARPAATTHGSAAAHPPANTLIGHCGTGSSISTAGYGAPMVLPAFTPN